MTVTNRLTRFLDAPDPDCPVPALRSPAQQAAARKNGAKSRGPTTEEGKAKSRLNSLRHGLFAIVCPSHDPRDFHHTFRVIRQQLLEEFVGTGKPGFMLATLIDSLAHDVLQAGRARRMIEQHLLRQTSFDVTHQNKFDHARYAFLERARQPLADAIAALGKGRSVCLPADLIEPIAVEIYRIVDIAEDMIAPIPDLSPEWAPPLPTLQAQARQPYVPSPEAQAEIRHAKSLKQKCGRDWPVLGDVDTLMPLLSGERKFGKTFARRLALLLVEVQKELSRYEGVGRRMRKVVKLRADAALYGVANDLPKLHLMEDYLTKIERRIDRQLARIAALQLSGSFFQFPN